MLSTTPVRAGVAWAARARYARRELLGLTEADVQAIEAQLTAALGA